MYQQINPEQLKKILLVNPENMVVMPATEALSGLIILMDTVENTEPQQPEPPKKQPRKKAKPNPDMQPIPGQPKKRWKIDRDEVCRLRNEQGLSIEELARRMGCTTQTITNILTQLRSEGRLIECV